MAKTYSVEISDVDWKVLAWKHVDVNQHIDDLVTNRAKIGIKELAEAEIARRHEDPNWTDPIPASYEEILEGMVIKTAAEMMAESTEYIMRMVPNPDIANEEPAPSGFYPKT